MQNMEIILTIGLIGIVFQLSGINRGISNMQNSLFTIDSNLESLEDTITPKSFNPFDDSI